MAKGRQSGQKNLFSRFAQTTAGAMGHPYAFGAACLVIVAWGMTGPLFNFSDTWQLVINTGTTIVTFLMVFVIQNTQDRDSCAVQLKLDELLRSTKGAHNAILDLEELSQEDLEKFRRHYKKLAEKARKDVEVGLKDTRSPEG